MKKIISLILLIALTMCMSACSLFGESDPVVDSEVLQEACELLNKLSKKNYQKTTVDITTSTDIAELEANYVVTTNSVTYSIERLNLLPTDGDISNVSPDYKTTVTGYALIEEGQIIKLDGTNITLASYDELKGNFRFDESNLEDVIIEENRLKASVLSPSKFYNAEINITDLFIDVEYSQNTLTKITVSYNTANATVKTVYSFVA